MNIDITRTECETPKSPPGDYNQHYDQRRRQSAVGGVKHLNPRQGITIERTPTRCRSSARFGVKHLNPRQGITMQFLNLTPRRLFRV